MSDASTNEKILIAADSGDLNGIAEAIKEGANINAQDNYGCSALMNASLNNNLDVVEILLKNKADTNIIDDHGKTALIFASNNNYFEIVRLLLENNAEVNIKDKSGYTALMYATSKNHFELVKLLIASKAKLGTAHKIASDKGFTLITNYFESLTNDIPDYDSELIIAAKNDNLDQVETALIDGAYIETKEESTGMTALMYAAQNDNLPMVELLLKNNAEIDAKRKTSISNGDTALMFACAKGNLEIVKLLIKKGSEVNAETSFTFDSTKQNDTMDLYIYNISDTPSSTALISASKNGHLEVVKFLLDNYANIDTKSKNLYSKGKTAFLFACEHGHFEVVKLLLDNKANVHAKSDSGETALMCAIKGNYSSLKKEYLEIVKLLLDKKIDVNANSNFSRETALMIACEKKTYDKDSLNRQTILVQLLIESGADMNSKNKDGKTALMLAKENHKSNIVTLLNNLPSQMANNDLLESVEKGDLDGVKNALAAGADIDIKDKYNESTALTLAISKDNIDIVKLLLEKNSNSNLAIRFDRTPLMCAVYTISNQNAEMIKLLLEKKAEVNAIDINQMTALLFACANLTNNYDFQKSYLDIVTLLIEAGANINMINKVGITPLMYAATIWYPDIVKYLIDKGANIYAKDKKGKTAFMYASEKGSLPIVKCLYKKNIDLNETDKEGNTALMFAAQNGHLDVVKFLVENKANFQLENQSELNASLIAWNNLDRTEYLLRDKNYNPRSKKNKNINEFLRDNHINIDAIFVNGSNRFFNDNEYDLLTLRNRMKSVVDYFHSIWKDNQE